MELLTRITKPIPRRRGYHDFADKRMLVPPIPHSMDVLSNVALLVPALYLISIQRKLSLLSVHMILLAITSAYYHLDPTNDTIFFDMVFLVSVNTIVLSYFISPHWATCLYLAGIASVVYWRKSGDIRFYEGFKIGIPLYLVVTLYDRRLLKFLVPIMGLGIGVRWAEFNDKKIYSYTDRTISGHTLKHIFGGLQLGTVVLCLRYLGKI